ncbi:MAG: hypothetical protein ACUVTN_12295, partial [Thermodesulfobacteriota bacterium]
PINPGTTSLIPIGFLKKKLKTNPMGSINPQPIKGGLEVIGPYILLGNEVGFLHFCYHYLFVVGEARL